MIYCSALSNDLKGLDYMIKRLIFITIACFSLLMVGCAGVAQKPVNLDNKFISAGSETIVITMTAINEPTTMFPGASCLLCIAAANLANSSLNEHVTTLEVEGLNELKQQLSMSFKDRGYNTVIVDDVINLEEFPEYSSDTLNSPKNNFSSLAKANGAKYVLVIDIQATGFRRQYSSYFPVNDPQALFMGTAFMVNIDTQQYEWYLPLSILKAAEGNWDEVPNFPALTNAYYQVVEQGKNTIMKQLETSKN